KEQPPGPHDGTEPAPVFTHVGVYAYAADISSTAAGTGLTTSGLAFFDTLRLAGTKGQKATTGQPLEYMMEWAERVGLTPPTFQQITPAIMHKLRIGKIQRWDPSSDPSSPF